MSDVEVMTQRNWEQRRHAEEYAAQMAEENKVIYLERVGLDDLSVSLAADSSPCAGEPRKRNRGRMAKAAKTAGRMALVMSTASALAGMELIYPLFGLVAVVFYTLYFELSGRNGLWQKIR